MRRFHSHFLERKILGMCLALAFVGVVTGGRHLHGASLQQALTALGLTEIPGDLTAPAFGLPDLAGLTVSLQDYQGKVVMLYFWTTW